ncbi:NnrS family protein [Pseudovibrio sp. WM33]|uniref:NnrS family protein n=1 Tax=Pseudovibrio sp. WM33 TaxID=1735585 RepID=UPI0007AE836A|nr:NnrS family protein [Pseudovibrio sp. WM33]KZL25937.1 NnrS protein [Pseudovibrio sp. WM33]
MTELSHVPAQQVSFFDAPVFSEGFRVFFPLSALYAVFSIVVWGLVLADVLPVPLDADPLLFHQYEMFFGFFTGAMAGFLTTAVPSWSNTPKIAGAQLVGLGALWLAGRVAFWMLGVLSPTVVFVVQALLPAALLIVILPRLWRAKMRHLMWPVLLLCVAQLVCFWEYTQIGVLNQGLAIAEGAFVLMVLTALAPVSMVIVNDALSTRDDGAVFVPRPPMRRAAMFCISAFTLAKVLGVSDALQGWLALASACAVLNILQDWHMAGALRTFFAKALYLVYWFFGVGFALEAGGLLGLLSAGSYVSGQHMIFIGGLSLATFMVLTIAGLRHAGYSLKLSKLLGAAILSLISACLVRSLGPLLLPDLDVISLAWSLFALAFTLYLIHFLPVVLRENFVK